MPTKQTPKSCSCRQCTRGKHTKTGHFFMRKAEHSLRHKAKVILRNQDDPIIDFAPMGDYYD